MADTSPGSKWLGFVPAISLLIVVVGALLATGGVIAQVRDNTRRLDAVERKVELLQTIDTRTARIEAKLEVLAQPRDKTP